jgi:PAS domain S-box-containing protein
MAWCVLKRNSRTFCVQSYGEDDMWTSQLRRAKWANGPKISARFGFALALLVTIGMVSYLTMLRLRETDQWEARIEAVIAKLDVIAAQLKDVESGEGGYLITGDERYLEAYYLAKQAINPELRDLRGLITDDPNYQRKIDRLAPLIAAAFAEIAQTNSLRQRQGFEPAAQMILTHHGKPIMDATLPLIRQLLDEENALLQQQNDDAEARAQTTNLSITFGSFLAIMLAAFMISRDMIERKRADAALRESAARFHRLAQNALDMIYRYRLLPSPGFEYVSPAATVITGYDPEEFYADPDLGYKLVHPADRELIEVLQHPAASSVPLTVRWIQKGGAITWTSQQLVPIYDPDGNLMAIEGIVRDVSERMQAYQMLELRVEERTIEIERRRQVAEGLRDIVTILNSNRPLDEILEVIVAQACRLLGTDAGAVYQLQEHKDALSIQVAYGLDADHAALQIPVGWGTVGAAVLKRQLVATTHALTDQADTNDLIVDAQQSARLTALFSHFGAVLAVPLMVKDDSYGVIALYYRQPHEFTKEETELAVALGDQAALAIENARLRTQAERMAVAAERSRLARDLHDAVTQTLFSTCLIADVLPRLWERDQQEGRRRLEELRQLTRGALAEMRTLLLELRPTALAEVDLGELLHLLAKAISGRTRVPITVTVDGRCVLPPDVQVAMYRIAQEALNNVARHANASQVAVWLCCGEDAIELRISDNGQGFDPSCVAPGHLGLNIMRERAETLGAALQIISRPEAGAQVAIIWPRGGRVDGEAYARPGALAQQPLALAGSAGYE